MPIPLNILMVSLPFKPREGRLPEYAHQLARHFHLGGDQVTVLAAHTRGDEQFDARVEYEILRAHCGMDDRSTDMRVMTFLPEWLRIVEYIARAARADCLLCNGPFPLGLASALVSHRLCIPYLVIVHGKEVLDRASLALRQVQKDYAVKRADLVICLSRRAQTRAVEEGVPPGRTAVIPSGVDPDVFRPTGTAGRLRRRFGLRGHGTILAGRPGAGGMGADRVLNAIEMVLDGIPNTVYVVAGGGPGEEAFREGVARSPGLRTHVRFAGPVTDRQRAELYNACDVVAKPSPDTGEEAEGDEGHDLVEAGACGKPVIADRWGGSEEAVADGYTGILVDPWDPADLAYGLSMLLTDRDYAARLGENGLRRAREELAWPKIAARVREKIRQAVEQG